MRLAIVNDTEIAIELLKRILGHAHSILWVARDGKEAAEKCKQEKPDIILMDMIMPRMNGVEAIKTIMRTTPCAILIVTESVNQNVSMVFEAMSHGALDAIKMPGIGEDGKLVGDRELLSKIAMISAIISKEDSYISTTIKAISQPQKRTPKRMHLVIIGASTGGPAALADLLSGLPQNFDNSIIIIQHVDEQFSSDLVTWLGKRTSLKVKLAVDGCFPEPGTILVSGKNDHLVMMKNQTLKYTPEPVKCFYRPSVDVFFQSVASYWPEKDVAVLLTGMGRDGAKGMLELRRAGWHTIAQDQKTSVIFGMPKAAIELGAVDEVLPLQKITPTILTFLRRKGN